MNVIRIKVIRLIEIFVIAREKNNNFELIISMLFRKIMSNNESILLNKFAYICKNMIFHKMQEESYGCV